MVRLFTVLLLALAAHAQQAPFTLEQALSAAFPSSLTAAPTAARVAWVSSVQGARNIMVAEAPRFQARKLTNISEDDGQDIGGLCWTPGANAVLYVRGGSANPALNPNGVSEDVWIVALDGSAPRKIGEGNSPDVSPRGDRVAFVRAGQVWLAPIDGMQPAARAFQARGEARRPTWSPDGSKLAFTSARGDHAFIGVWDAAANSLRYLDPSTDVDAYPAWSPDSRSLAFIRIPSSGLRQPREAHRAGEPWSIRVASAETGAGRQIWRAREGAGSVFHEVATDGQLLWTASGRLVFPWEADGWTHLYSVPAAGGEAKLLTPGAFEVEHVALTPGAREIVYSSNQGDSERRHLWRVTPESPAPAALTTGDSIECRPAVLSDGSVAFLRTDARTPLRAAIRVGGETRDMDPTAIPPGFPSQQMVTPEVVTFASADGLTIHGQLFLPRVKAAVRAPAVVFFHGGPRRQMMLGWNSMEYYYNAYSLNQYLAAQGYVVLSVNFRSGTGYGLNFREAPGFGASGASEYADVRAAALYLRSRADVDPARIGAWGGSYGGFLTALALARSSDLYKAGVDFHGVHDWAVELGIPATAPDYRIAFDASPMAFLDTWRSPVLLIHADDDPDVLFKNTVMLAAALRKRNVEVEQLIIPDEVHDFLMRRTWLRTYSAAVEFLNRKLK
jgi:dipeptidyl aminopeptidase/acylaminoacyl peptidase